MLEKYLIAHCSPTLASLKTASLFRLPVPSAADLQAQLTQWNRTLAGKGITLLALQRCGGTALVYVFRKSRLREDLCKPEVARFLSAYGYESAEPDAAIGTLKSRLEAEGGFPHEIGLFLGYPLGDVAGFIRNAGRNFKCAGCWKVYGDEQEAARQFARYKKCREVYGRLWKEGRSVWQLIVAA